MASDKGEKRELFLFEDIKSSSSERTISKILEINRFDNEEEEDVKRDYRGKFPRKPIILNINSFGGAVYDALGIIDTIKTSKTPVHTIVRGYAMSAAFCIASVGHLRFANKNSTLMYHSVSSISYGMLEDLKDDLEEAQRLQDLMDQIVVSNSNITIETLKKYQNLKKNWFISSKEALKLGLIDKII